MRQPGPHSNGGAGDGEREGPRWLRRRQVRGPGPGRWDRASALALALARAPRCCGAVCGPAPQLGEGGPVRRFPVRFHLPAGGRGFGEAASPAAKRPGPGLPGAARSSASPRLASEAALPAAERPVPG